MTYDVIIVGSGPAGLSAAIYCLRAGKKVLVIEKEFEGTGQIASSYLVDNYLGLPGIGGYELGEKFREHALSMGAVFLEAEVTHIEKIDNLWSILLDDETSHKTKTVIYAAGAKHRKLSVIGEEEFAGKGVSYCATCDGAFFKEKDVAVIGGGDTAVDDALYLSNICHKVYLVHRREQFRTVDTKIKKLKEKKNIEFILNATVQSIQGEKMVESLTISNKHKTYDLSVSGVFVAIGMNPLTEVVHDLLPLDSNGYIEAKEDGITNQPGFYVAGDVRAKSLRQVVTAVSDGANAAVSAIAYLDNVII